MRRIRIFVHMSPDRGTPIGNRPFWHQAALVLLALVLYGSSIGFGTALDDGLVLSDNAYVKQGFAGIPDILTHDSFHGSIGESAYLSGGRYRPLSQLMFAAEVGLAGGVSAPLHHAINVLLYALTGLVILRFLDRWLFRSAPGAALVVTLLYLVHPLHVEVVANIKSRDELLSLLLLLLSLDALLQWAQAPRVPTLAAAIGWLSLALLAKENAVIMALLVPVSFHVLTPLHPRRWWPAWVSVCAVIGAYVLLRMALIGTQVREVTEVMDNPYLLATTAERIGTILHVFGKYLLLLLWPHPLTYDYSYAQIAYRTPGDPAAWLPGLVLLALLATLVHALRHRDALAWCIAFFLLTWGLVSGLLFNIGAPMAERFMYQASLPFLVGLVIAGDRALNKWNTSARTDQRTVPLATAGLVIAGALGTWQRLPDWKDNDTLLLHDVAVSTGSARANTYAGIAAIHRCDAARNIQEKSQWAQQAITWFKAAEAIKPDYVPIWLNMGVAWERLDSLEQAEAAWEKVRAREPDNPLLRTYDAHLFRTYYTRGLQAGTARDLPVAMRFLDKAVRYGPGEADAWYNLGGACFTAGDTARSRAAWTETLRIDPAHAGALLGLAALDR